MFAQKTAVAIVLAAFVAGMSACTSSTKTDELGGPGFDVKIDPNQCHNPYIMVSDWQSELGSAIETGDAPCAAKTLTLGARIDEQVKDAFGQAKGMPIEYALSDSALWFAATGGHKGFEVLKVLTDSGADLNAKLSNGQAPLQFALQDNILEKYSVVAAWMIQSGKASIEVLDRNGNTPLLDVLQRQKRDQINQLVAAGANVMAKTMDGTSTLQLAIQDKYEDLALQLLGKGVDPMSRDREGNTSLHASAQKGMVNLTRAILAKNVNVNGQNNARETALLLAVRGNANAIAKDLVAKGADSNLASNTEAPIHAALRNNNDALITMLIPLVRDINVRDSSGNTPLLLATEQASAVQVQAILNRSADANLADNRKMTPVMYALQAGQSDKVQALVAKSNLNLRGPDGQPAIFFASNSGDVQLLLNNGADMNARSDSGSSPLSAAVKNSNTGVAVYLINAGANVKWTDTQGTTLLHQAIQGDLSVARALLDHGVDANSADVSGITPIFFARSVEAIDLLVQYRADVNHLSVAKRSALLGAVERYVSGTEAVWAIVEHLVSLNADVNVKDAEGESLLHLAVMGTPLMRSSEPVTYPKLLSLLLQREAAVNAVDIKRNTPLHVADTDVEVAALLKAGANRNLQNSDRRTPLQIQKINEGLLNNQMDTDNRAISQLQDEISRLPANDPRRDQKQRELQRLQIELAKVTKQYNMTEKIIDLLLAN
jgi:ankyrin repeat protein